MAWAAGAQQVDMDLMAKWAAVTVVRYAVVGEFAGEPVILSGAQGFKREGRVTDRVELTFDWNQNETALVGTPTFKNFPSHVSLSPVAGCPPVRMTGAYDHTEILSVKQVSSVLQVATKRSYPAGSIPLTGESTCGGAWDNAEAKTETTDIMLLVLPTTYFSMPSAAGSGLTISKDRKSMVLLDENNGWTWTYTPTPVR